MFSRSLPLGAIMLIVVVALAVVGVAYGLWFERLWIHGTVETGNVDVEFSEPETWENDHDKDVGTCTALISREGDETPTDTGENRLTIAVNNAYPSYECWVKFDVTSLGSIPVHLGQPIPDAGDFPWTYLENCWVDDQGDPFDPPVPPQLHQGESAFCTIYIHFLNAEAEEGQSYSFSYYIDAWQFNEGPPPPPHPQVAAGGIHSCGVRNDGTLACWGDDTHGQVSNTPGDVFQNISEGGGFHTCGVRSDDTLACWGRDAEGQVSNTPSGIFQQVSAGNLSSCGVRSDGTLACWGDDAYGKVSSTPGGTFQQVSADGDTHCGVGSDGTLACWGADDAGQVSSTPSGTFQQVEVGWRHICGVRSDGTLACWGRNVEGQTNLPSGTFQHVSAGNFHSCGLRSDGTLACWGDPTHGAAAPPGGTFRQVGAGAFHSCGVQTDDTLVCWGNNDQGQLNVPAGFP